MEVSTGKHQFSHQNDFRCAHWSTQWSIFGFFHATLINIVHSGAKFKKECIITFHKFHIILHCYKNYSPLQLVGTKHHGFVTLVGPKSKHFGFQYKLMGEGYDVLKVHNRVITSAKSLNLLSTSWNCSKEFELASLEA